MANIRINELPLEIAPTSSEVLAIDGTSTPKATIKNVVDAGAPVASQSEAQDGVNNVNRMTPLTTKQSIASEIGVTISSQANGALAATAVQPSRQIVAGAGLTGGGDLSVDRTLNVGAGTGIDVTADAVGLDSVTQSRLIPSGGNTGQVLAKTSNTNYDVFWSSAGSGDVVGPNGGVANNFPVAFDTTTGKLIKAITGAIAALHGVTPAADRLPYFTGGSSASLATLTAFARTVLDDTTGAAMFATMGATLSYTSPAGWTKLPNGLLLQFGTSVVTTVGEIVGIPFGAAFSATPLLVLPVNGDTNQPNYASAFGVHSATSTSFVVRTANYSGTSRVNWIAIGLAP